MAESSLKGWKTLWEKEKLLVRSNSSFSHSVFKRRVLQTRKSQGLFGKGLKIYPVLTILRVNSLPNDKVLDWSKLKAFADDKINVTVNSKFFMGRVENIVGKGKKCWLPAFFPFFHNVFKRLLFQGS